MHAEVLEEEEDVHLWVELFIEVVLLCFLLH